MLLIAGIRVRGFRLLELAQELECAATDVLIRVAQVVAEIIAHEDHLWQQLAAGLVFSTTSQYTRSSFLIMWSLGTQKRITVISCLGMARR